MARHVTGSEFGWKMAWRVGIFLGLTLAFPFIVYGLVVASGANKIGGAGGALAAVIGIYLKPLIIVVFLLAIIAPCWKRMRSLGIFPMWGLIVPLLVAMDFSFLFAAGNFWGANFSVGILKAQLPLHALTALALMVAMAIALPPMDTDRNGVARYGILGHLLGIVAIVLALLTLAVMAYNIWWYWSMMTNRVTMIVPTQKMLWPYLAMALRAKFYGCIALGSLALIVALMSRRNGDGAASAPPRLMTGSARG